MPDIADQLDAAIGAAPPDAPALEPTLALGRRALRRRRLAYGVGAAATAVVIGGTAWAVSPGDNGSPRTDDPGFAGSPSDAPSDAPTQPQDAGDPGADQGQQGGQDGQKGQSGQTEVWPGVPRDDLVRFSEPELSLPEPGTLVPLQGTEIIDQRPGVDLGESFAGPGDRTGVALVTSNGSRTFVVARAVDGGPAEYIAVPATSAMDTLDVFIAFARERYAEGGGGLL